MEKRAQQTGQQHVNTLVLGNMRACISPSLHFPPQQIPDAETRLETIKALMSYGKKLRVVRTQNIKRLSGELR